MIRLAALLCVFAFPAMAQDWLQYSPQDPDDLVIRPGEDAGTLAEIVYDNAAALSSTSGHHVLLFTDPDTQEQVEVAVQIEVGGQEVDGAEIIRVTPPDAYMALPDYAEVPDGEVFIVRIVRAMF